MDDGPHFVVLSEPRPTPTQGCYLGVQSQNGLCGGYMFFVLGQKARGGCSLWEQEAREVKPSAGPKYGIARSPGLGFTRHKKLCEFNLKI
jgi:hypothetical protein